MKNIHRWLNFLTVIAVFASLGIAYAGTPVAPMQARSIPILGQDSPAVVYYLIEDDEYRLVVTWVNGDGTPTQHISTFQPGTENVLNLASLGLPLQLDITTDTDLAGLELQPSVAFMPDQLLTAGDRYLQDLQAAGWSPFGITLAEDTLVSGR